MARSKRSSQFVVILIVVLVWATGLFLGRASLGRNTVALQVIACAVRGSFPQLPLEAQTLPRDELALWLRCPAVWVQPQVKTLARTIVPKDAIEAYYVGQILALNGAPTQALKTWQRFPSISRIFGFECTRDLNRQACDAARNACIRATEIDSQYGDGFAELGRVYAYCFKRYGDAENAFGRAAALGVDNKTFWLAYAHVLNIQGEFVAAARIAEEHNLSGALADAIRAGGARALGQLTLAVELYERAIAAAPNDPWIYHGLASSLLELGKEQDALRAWQKALEIDSHFAPAREGIDSLQREP